jgi:DNA-binding beta-propeller fold protein YncE
VFDVSGNIYVSDSLLHSVVVFSLTAGEYIYHQTFDIRLLCPLPARVAASFGIPKTYGLAFTSKQDLVVVDSDRIVVIDREGLFKHTFASSGSGNGMLLCPRGVCVGNDDRIIVADFGNCRIVIFDSKGIFQQSLILSCSPGNLLRPFGVTAGVGGDFVVSDFTRDSLSVFNAQGVLVQKISADGDSKVQLFKPWGVAVDDAGCIFFTDRRKASLEGRLSKISNTPRIIA